MYKIQITSKLTDFGWSDYHESFDKFEDAKVSYFDIIDSQLFKQLSKFDIIVRIVELVEVEINPNTGAPINLTPNLHNL